MGVFSSKRAKWGVKCESWVNGAVGGNGMKLRKRFASQQCDKPSAVRHGAWHGHPQGRIERTVGGDSDERVTGPARGFKAVVPDVGSYANPCVRRNLRVIAGDRIRTDDVQLGKLAFYH